MFYTLPMIYYDHGILSSSRAHGWRYCRNIWNCDKGVPAQIERNGFQSQICSEVHLQFFPLWLLVTSKLSASFSSVSCVRALKKSCWAAFIAGLVVSAPWTDHHKQTQTGRENRLRAPHQAGILEHASAVPGHRWVGPHGLEYPSFDHLGCGFTCKERDVNIHVSMHIIKGKSFPVPVADSLCFVDASASAVYSLQLFYNTKLSDCRYTAVMRWLNWLWSSPAREAHYQCSPHVCPSDCSLACAGRWQLSDRMEKKRVPYFSFAGKSVEPHPPTLLHRTLISRMSSDDLVTDY